MSSRYREDFLYWRRCQGDTLKRAIIAYCDTTNHVDLIPLKPYRVIKHRNGNYSHVKHPA